MSNPAVASPIGVVFVSVCQRLISLHCIQYCCISCSLAYICSAFVAIVLSVFAAIQFIFAFSLFLVASCLSIFTAILFLVAICLLLIASGLLLVTSGLLCSSISEFLKSLNQFFGCCLVGIVSKRNFLSANVCLDALYALLKAHVVLYLVLARFTMHLWICGYNNGLNVFCKTCDSAQRQC